MPPADGGRAGMGGRVTAGEFLDLLRRRAVLVAGVLMFGLALSIATGLGQSPVWRAGETLRIAPARVSADLADLPQRASLAARLPLLSGQVQSRTALAEIATAYGLFPDLPSLDHRSGALARAVAIRWAPDASGTLEIVAEARLAAPEDARLVAAELAHRLVRAAAEMRLDDALATRDFLARKRVAATRSRAAAEARFATGGLADATDLDDLRATEAELSRRLAQAEALVDLEQRRQSERLVVIDPAGRPVAPERDLRGPVIALGGALSACVAALVALWSDARRPALRNAARMRRLTGIAPLVEIPLVAQPTAGTARRRWTWPRRNGV